jgi:ATP-dependent RNA helicase DDX10/DBP4
MMKNEKNFDKKNFNKNKQRGDNDQTLDQKVEKKLTRTQIADLEIEELDKRLKEETPPCGFYYLNTEEEQNILNNYKSDSNLEEEKWKKTKNHFKEVPLTRKTLKGLTDSRFLKMTPIQRATLAHSLAGRDILGASKTGSGKTLCFIIPVLEILYRNKWSSLDGLGALLILPTRELAIQVFEVFKLVGRYHDFSVGLVIGGNNVNEEKDRLYKMNILIGTPGRLLQHFTETPYFNTDNLKLLVIDEVDRILDEGFEESLNEILTYLPIHRQTLLFSATLTRSLKRLARLNSKTTPEYININNTDSLMEETENITEKNEISLLNKNNIEKGEEQNQSEKKSSQSHVDNSITPINLNQFYTLVETHDKIDILYSFLKSHKNSKCLVFLNSCKQVRYFYEVFRRLKLGMTFLDLHGKQKQNKRTNIFYSFLQKKNTVLFATDVASRGVDFPHVDWVIQLDCPENVQTYIHRVGRTARYKSKGNSILMVNPKEENFINILNKKNISIKKIKINQSKLVNLQPIIRSILSENPDLIYLAQKSISSYIKSVYLQNDKEIFDINSIDIQKLALSYGLVNMPELKIMKKSQNDLKNLKRDDNLNDDDENDEEPEEPVPSDPAEKKKSKLQKLKEKIKQKKLQKTSEVANRVNNNEGKVQESSDNEEDDFLQEKRKKDKSVEDLDEEPKKSSKKNKKRKVEQESDDENSGLKSEALDDGDNYYENIKKRLDKNKESDKIKEKLRILEKHKQDRIKRKQHDYEKHGLLEESGDEEEGERPDSDNENSIDIPELVEDDETSKPKKQKKKVNINLKTSTLEEKEKAALELLDTDNLFV